MPACGRAGQGACSGSDAELAPRWQGWLAQGKPQRGRGQEPGWLVSHQCEGWGAHLTLVRSLGLVAARLHVVDQANSARTPGPHLLSLHLLELPVARLEPVNRGAARPRRLLTGVGGRASEPHCSRGRVQGAGSGRGIPHGHSSQGRGLG